MIDVALVLSHALGGFVAAIVNKDVAVVARIDFYQRQQLPIARNGAGKVTIVVLKDQLSGKVSKLIFIDVKKPLISFVGCDVVINSLVLRSTTQIGIAWPPR